MAAKKNANKRKSAKSKSAKPKSAKPKLKKPVKVARKSKPKKSASDKPAAKIAKARPATKKAAKNKKKTVATKRAAPAKAVAAKAVAKKAPAGKKAAQRTTRTDSRLVDLDAGLEPNIRRARSGGQSGDLQGLSDAEGANSESVDELLEEGNSFEAGAVAGVEEADNEDEREVHTHEVSEDDVPDEYLEKDE